MKGKEKRKFGQPKTKIFHFLYFPMQKRRVSVGVCVTCLVTQWVALVNKNHNISPYPCPKLTQHYSLNRNHNIYYLDNKQYFSITQECWNDFNVEYWTELCSLSILTGERWCDGNPPTAWVEMACGTWNVYTEIFSRMSNGNSILFIGHKRKFILDFITEREYISMAAEALPMSWLSEKLFFIWIPFGIFQHHGDVNPIHLKSLSWSTAISSVSVQWRHYRAYFILQVFRCCATL